MDNHKAPWKCMKMKEMTRKTPSYLVDIRKTAASRITSDTTS